MVTGKSLLMPTLEHAEAVVKHIDQLEECIEVRDSMIVELLTDVVAAETKVRILERERKA